MKEDNTQKKGYKPILKKYEKEKTLVLESISEHIVFQDKKHNILWLNKAAADSVETTKEELIGEKCYSVWQKSNKSCIGCPIDASLEIGDPMSGEISTPDGKVFFIRGFPVRDKKGKIIGVVELTQNITKLKQTEKI